MQNGENYNGKELHGKTNMSKTRQKINKRQTGWCLCMLNYFYFHF